MFCRPREGGEEVSETLMLRGRNFALSKKNHPGLCRALQSNTFEGCCILFHCLSRFGKCVNIVRIEIKMAQALMAPPSADDCDNNNKKERERDDQIARSPNQYRQRAFSGGLF